ARVAAIRENAELALAGRHKVGFHNRRELITNKRKSLPEHPNGMIFNAYDSTGNVLAERRFFSVGGGFVVEPDASGSMRIVADATEQRYPFTTAEQLIGHCRREGVNVSDIMLANEL